MGKEFVVNTLEEMCDLMCNNILPKEHKYCLRCGRKLKTPENRLRGYGKICWLKIQKNKRRKLF